MAISEIYVDPSIAADSGAGTIGDPFGDLEYAIKQTTFDTTNGTQVNIKSSATETLVANLVTSLTDTSVSVAWVPSAIAPLVFRGYTSAANDGGKFTVSGGGSVAVFSGSSRSYTSFIDGRATNCGANIILSLDNHCAVINMEVDTCSGTSGIDCDTGCLIERCYVHDCSGSYGIAAIGGASHVRHCVVETDGALYGIGLGSGASVVGNIVVTTSIGDNGIGFSNGDGGIVENNSIYSSVANTAAGIIVVAVRQSAYILNNLIEGFSGTGGIGVYGSGTSAITVMGGNSFYNCETDSSYPNEISFDYGDNEALTASPFTSASTGDFSPVDTGNVKEGSLPQTFNAAYP